MTTSIKPSQSGHTIASKPDRVFQIRIPDDKVNEFVHAFAQVKMDDKGEPLQGEIQKLLGNIRFDKQVVEDCLRPNLMIEEIFPRLIRLRAKLLERFGTKSAVSILAKKSDKEFLESPRIQIVAWLYYINFIEKKLAPYKDQLELEVVLWKLKGDGEFNLLPDMKLQVESPASNWINEMKSELSNKFSQEELEQMTGLQSQFDLYDDLFYKLLHTQVPSNVKKSIKDKLIAAIVISISQECPDEKRSFIFTLAGYIASDVGYLLTKEEYGTEKSISFDEYLHDKVKKAVDATQP